MRPVCVWGGRLLEPQAPLESLGLLRCGSRGEQEPAPWLGPHPEAGGADAPPEEDGQPGGREGEGECGQDWDSTALGPSPRPRLHVGGWRQLPHSQQAAEMSSSGATVPTPLSWGLSWVQSTPGPQLGAAAMLTPSPRALPSPLQWGPLRPASPVLERRLEVSPHVAGQRQGGFSM